MDPSGAIHTTALLERTRFQGKISALLVEPTLFLTHCNPAKQNIRNSSEVMIVHT